MFVVINAISIACIVFWYLIKNTISVSTSIMSHVKAAYENMTDKTCHICV